MKVQLSILPLAALLTFAAALLTFAAALPSSAAAPLGPQDALTVRDGVIVTQSGRRIGLWGVNLFQSHLHWSRRQDPEDYRTELAKIAAAGFNAVRMPLNMSYFVPAPGVYPDDPRYNEILAAHRLPTGAMAFYDGLIAEAGRLGIYVIPEFHELPSNPYRWFVGGVEADRGTGKPGTAIAWMAKEDDKGNHQIDPELARTEVPAALAWLARHWRGVPNIAGIEVPWNEPHGDFTQPEPFLALAQATADAVKEADPDRLVFLCTVDWGAMVNYLPDESLWKIPDSVDVLFPHFYPGMHSNSSGEEGTWSTTMASWASWLAGSGRPVMIGEYGIVEMHRGQYWKGEISEQQKASTYGACAAQWHAQGIQGLFAWAWQGGLDQDDETGLLTAGAHVLPLWADAYRNMDRTPLAKARVAVVCTRSRRSPYGSRQDLWQVSDALLDAQITPFASLFDTQIQGQPDILKRFDVLLVLAGDLPEDVLATVRASGKPVHELDAQLTTLSEVVDALKILPGLAAPGVPSNVLVATGASQVTLFERKGAAATVRVPAAPADARGMGRLVADDGTVVFAGDAATIPATGYEVALGPWQTLRLTWSADTVFGILQNTPENYASNFEAGARMGHLSLHWTRYFPAEGAKDAAYIAGKRSELKALREAGFSIMLDFGIQYPPAWIYEAPNSRFVNQYGDAYAGGIGETGVNGVFNDAMRRKQADYVRDVLAEFGKEVDIVRLGFMRYSEIGYPHPTFKDRTNSYWAYDGIAQGMVAGLPEGVVPCPVPGWIPGTASDNHEDARRFADWYIRSLQNYHDWQINLVAGLFEGRLAMLYPSWGIRRNQLEEAVRKDLAGTTSAEKNGEIQRGFDFKGFVEGIDNPKVIVCGTWVDSNPAWSDDDAADPQNPCPIHFLANLAKSHPLKLRVMGENTGGGGLAAMDLTFERTARYGLEGLMWAFESHLYDGKPPTLEDFARHIAASGKTGLQD